MCVSAQDLSTVRHGTKAIQIFFVKNNVEIFRGWRTLSMHHFLIVLNLFAYNVYSVQTASKMYPLLKPPINNISPDNVFYQE